MRIAYLDCFSGISGDMFLGALVDAGVPVALLRETVAALAVNAQLELSKVMRGGISATKLDVVVAGEKDLPREVFQERVAAGRVARAPSPAAVHHPPHDDAGHHHEHPPGEPRSHSHAHGGSLKQIRQMIARSAIGETAKARATAMFQALGEAEAEIHQTDLESIHFHEVGSVDAIVDMVCAAVGAEALGVDEWVCSPLNVGGGTVECAHGTFPVPAPATLELLRRRNAPMYSSGVQKELVTPTGAAIVSVLATRFAPVPPMTVERTGYGAGYRELAGQPNVLRITIGEAQQELSSSVSSASSVVETVTVLEANLDDTTPEVIGYASDRLLAEGALDVFAMPVQMKKHRPGTLLTVLCRPADADRFTDLLFAETSTLGVRRRNQQRRVLARRHVTVETRWGTVRMKLAGINGTVTNYAPEYEDCRRVAAQHQVPLKTVMQEAIRLYLDQNS